MHRATIEDDLDGARLGDPLARGRVLAFLQPRIHRFLGARLRAVESSALEDLAQETLWRAWRGFDGCRATSPGQATTWAISIARRVLADHRREAPPETIPLEGVPQATFLTWSDPPDILDSTIHLATQVAGREAMRLPAEAGLLLWCRLQAAATWEEVAAVLGTTPDGAKRRFQRLKKRLAAVVRREVLSQLGRPPPEWLEARPPPIASGRPDGVSRRRLPD